MKQKGIQHNKTQSQYKILCTKIILSICNVPALEMHLFLLYKVTETLNIATGPEAWYTPLVEENQALNDWSCRHCWTLVFGLIWVTANGHFCTSEVSDVI